MNILEYPTITTILTNIRDEDDRIFLEIIQTSSSKRFGDEEMYDWRYPSVVASEESDWNFFRAKTNEEDLSSHLRNLHMAKDDMITFVGFDTHEGGLLAHKYSHLLMGIRSSKVLTKYILGITVSDEFCGK